MKTSMRGRTARNSVWVSGALALALVTSACGSSDSSSSSDGSVDDAGLAAASDFLAKYQENPTSIGELPPLKSKPEAGKDIVYLSAPIPASVRLSRSLKSASKALSWNYSDISVGATPATAASAFDAALAQGPDAIVFAGTPAASFTSQIAKAKATGITVVSTSTGDGKVDGVLADLGGKPLVETYGKVVAAYFIDATKGKGKAVVVTLPAYPITTIFVKSFQSAVKEWCPGCGVKVLDQQVTDVGTKTPANVVGALQRDRDVKWVVVSNGDLSQGLAPALKQASLTGVHIIGQVPSQANMASLRAGTEQAWAGFPIEIGGWRLIDILARQFAGDDVKSTLAVLTPLQMITGENIDKVVLDDDDFYVGVADFAKQFEKLWLLDGAE